MYRIYSHSQVGDINLCALALNFKRNDGKRSSEIYDFPRTEIMSIMETYGLKVKKATTKNIGLAFVEFVNEKCSDACLVCE